MKKLLLTLALLLAPSLAWGQCNGVFPSNTMCGSVLGGAPGPVAFSTFNPVFNTISAVTALTAVPSGNVVNNFQITSDNVDAGTGFILGTRRQYVFGGSSVKGGRIAGYDFIANIAITNASNLNRSYAAHSAVAYTNFGDGGTNNTSGAKGGYFGTNPLCQLDTGGVNVQECTGGEFDTYTTASSSVRYLRSASLVGFNVVHGGQIDSALTISGGTGHAGWNNPILFTDANRGTIESPVNSGSTLFGTYWQTIGTQTILNGIDLTGFAPTGCSFKSTGFCIDNSANITGNYDTGGAGNAFKVAGTAAGTVAQLQSVVNSSFLRVVKTAVNFNSATTDTAVTIPLPTGVTRYLVNTVRISNASASISTATIGVFTATGGGGVTIAANQAITVTTGAADTNNNAMSLTITNLATTAYTDATLQIRIGTPQGSAATADVIFAIIPLS